MDRTFRPVFAFTLALLLALTAGCGDGDSNDPWKFKSKAKSPSGEYVKIAYDYEVGDGVRMVMKTKGTMTMNMNGEPQEQPVDMTMRMTMRCESIGDDGSRVMTTSLDGMEMPGMPAGALGADTFKGTVTIGADGSIKDVDFEGLDPTMAQSIKQAFQGGGFAGSIPMGEKGMRIGEAIDIKDVMPMDALKQAMANIPGAGSLEPAIEGEYVLVGTKSIDGVDAAEFAVNMVMTMDMDMGDEGKATMRMKTTGTQFVSLRTGLAIGESSIAQQMEMRLNSRQGEQDMSMAMDMDSTMTINAEPLSKDD